MRTLLSLLKSTHEDKISQIVPVIEKVIVIVRSNFRKTLQ